MPGPTGRQSLTYRRWAAETIPVPQPPCRACPRPTARQASPRPRTRAA